jgi:hypothetical protein
MSVQNYNFFAWERIIYRHLPCYFCRIHKNSHETELENISVLISFRVKNFKWLFTNSGGFQTRDLRSDKRLVFKTSVPVSL